MRAVKFGVLGMILCLVLTFSFSRTVLAEESSSATASAQSTGEVAARSVVTPTEYGAAAEDDLEKLKNSREQFQEVDPTGAFQYQYPLNLPPGANGMNPTLKLFYNSNSPNGMLGIGWMLWGIAEVKRDYSYPVNYNDTDHFMYNGEKLVKDSAGKYHTAKESYARIEYKNPNTGTSYWVVTQKNGTKMYFGYQALEHSSPSTGGRIEGIGVSGTDKTIVWSLSKVVDLQGNYYVLEYNLDATNGDFYPVRVTYTKNEKYSLAACKTIEFLYETRNDHYTTYSPTKIDTDKRLKWISIKMGGNLLRKYRLDYEQVFSGCSRLVSITEYGNDGNIPSYKTTDLPCVTDNFVATGKTLPPVRFEWQNNGSGWDDTSFGPGTQLGHWAGYTESTGQSFHFPGDFNGDGKTDFMYWESYKGWHALLSTGSGWEDRFFGPGTQLGHWAGYTESTGQSFHFPGDFNGDGKTDFMYWESGKGWRVLLSTGSGWEDKFFGPGTQLGYWAGYREKTSQNFHFTGDFNGDGKTDFMYWESGKGWRALLSTGSGWDDKFFGPGTQLGYWKGYTESTSQSFHFTGDFNGDGKTDLMYWESGKGWRALLSTGSGWDDKFFGPGTQLGYWKGYTESTGQSFHFAGDFNGDGKTDLMYWESGKGWRVLLSTGSGWDDKFFGPGTQLGHWKGYTESTSQSFHFTGDFNGDGKTDLMYWESAKGWRALLSTGSGWDDQFFGPGIQLGYWNGYNGTSSQSFQFPGDFNGDGKTDFMYWVPGSGWWALLNNKATVSDLLFNFDCSAEDSGLHNLFSLYLSANQPVYGTYSYGAIGKGSSKWLNNINDVKRNSYSVQVKYVVKFGDRKDENKSTPYFRVKLSDGQQLVNQSFINEIRSGTFVIPANDYVIVEWESGHRENEHTLHHDEQIGYVGSYSLAFDDNSGGDFSTSYVLKTIQNGQGGTTSISYLPLSQIPGAVQPNSSQYPNIANSSATPVVREITYDDGLSHLTKYRYDYSNAMLHTGPTYERANLGFAWIEKTDQNTGSSVRTYYRQDDLDLRLMVDQEEVYGSNRALYLKKQYQYDKRVTVDNAADLTSPGAKFIYVADEYAYNHNGESGDPVTYRIHYSYDDYGNLRQTINYGDTAVATDDRQSDMTYDYVAAQNLSLLKSEQQSGYLLSGQKGLIAQTDYAYNSSYLLDTKTQYNGSQKIINRYEYDPYGNVTALTDGRGNRTTFQYDSNYASYLRYRTNPLGQTEETRYDSLMNPIATVDVNGSVWQITYDGFSRAKSRISPGDDAANPTQRISYPDEFADSAGKPLFPNRQRIEKKLGNGNYVEYNTYSDGLERPVQSKIEAKNGWVTMDYAYDNSGRKRQTSVPYFTSGAAYTAPDPNVKSTVWTYDPIDRVSASKNPDGTVIQTLYGKQEIKTVDENLHLTSKLIIGNTESSLKFTGTYPGASEYSRTAKTTWGDAVQTVDPNGNRFLDRLDMLGRKVGSTDPVSGTWSYSYDENHNLTSWTDAKNQLVRLEYDALNRVTKKIYPNGSTVNFYYDETGYGYSKGRLTRAVYPGGEERYTYDSRGRQTAVTQIIDGQSRTKRLTYNSLDQIVTLTYPDGEVATYSYDAGGKITGLSGASAYVSALEYTALGKTGSLTYGNGVQTSYDYYDTAGKIDSSAGTPYSFLLKQIRVARAGSDLLNLGYEYDKTGNVKLKKDNLNSALSESYGYDELNRLTSASSGLSGSKTFRYDKLDNILQKDSRSYQYGAAKPYTLASDGRYSYSHDANGNMTARSDGRTLVWDYENRVTSISDGGTYAYNFQGQRLKKADANGVTRYYFFPEYEEEYQAGVKTKTVKYYFVRSDRVAERSSAEGVRYYHKDHLGSSTLITDANGNAVLKTTYAPYGSETSSQGSSTVAYTFTDKEKDNTGFIYFGARFYDPEVGRFISVDPAEDGANWYAYCNDNPVRFVDPDGLRVGDNDNGGWDGSGYDGDSESSSFRNNGYQYGGNSGSSGGSGSHSSSSSNDRIANVMGNVLPGSSSYGNAINSFENGDYLGAIGWTFAGAAEEFAFLCSFGTVGSLSRVALTAGKAEVLSTKIGTSYGKFGTVVENPNIEITEFSGHAINQAITRGVNPSAIQDTLNNPVAVLSQRGGGAFAYVSERAVVVVSKAGEVITVWGKETFSPVVKQIIGGGK
jgi:RHS repeat-associated protein